MRQDDLAIYKRLITICEELETLAAQSWSPASATSIRATAMLVRTLASGLWNTQGIDQTPFS
jgi:hypothetical protein